MPVKPVFGRPRPGARIHETAEPQDPTPKSLTNSCTKPCLGLFKLCLSDLHPLHLPSFSNHHLISANYSQRLTYSPTHENHPEGRPYIILKAPQSMHPFISFYIVFCPVSVSKRISAQDLPPYLPAYPSTPTPAISQPPSQASIPPFFPIDPHGSHHSSSTNGTMTERASYRTRRCKPTTDGRGPFCQ
jgi:hypothetical protein